MSVHQCLQEMVDGCIMNSSHVMPLYRKYKERVDAMTQHNAVSSGAETFICATRLQSLDRTAKFDDILQHSDIGDELLQLVAQHKDQVDDLMVLGLQ